MNLFDQQTIHGQGRAIDYKNKQMAALRGVITKQKKEIAKLKEQLEKLKPRRSKK